MGSVVTTSLSYRARVSPSFVSSSFQRPSFLLSVGYFSSFQLISFFPSV
jgi:hypothetical protein